MKLIVGLGNPGIKYQNNRHNVGVMFVDELKKEGNKKLKDIKIFKSDKFMNDSGSFIKKILTVHRSLSTDHLYIVHDDLDIKLGEYKIQFGRGPKGHNGILDIEEKLGTSEFWRVRVGVDPASRNAMQGEQLVLSDFTDEEKLVINGVIKQICNQLVV